MSDHHSDDGCVDSACEFASDLLEVEPPTWVNWLALILVLAILYYHWT